MKKLGLICLALIIAIGSIGLTYAKWSQNLTVSGTASSGTFDVVFNSFNAPPTGSDGATFTATPAGSHAYTLACNNIYPGLDGAFSFTLKATGSVPAKISHVYLKQGTTIIAADPSGAVDLKLDGDANYDISVTVSGLFPGRVLPADGSTAAGSLLVHTWIKSANSNDATPGAVGSFSIEIESQQQY